MAITFKTPDQKSDVIPTFISTFAAENVEIGFRTPLWPEIPQKSKIAVFTVFPLKNDPKNKKKKFFRPYLAQIQVH